MQQHLARIAYRRRLKARVLHAKYFTLIAPNLAEFQGTSCEVILGP